MKYVSKILYIIYIILYIIYIIYKYTFPFWYFIIKFSFWYYGTMVLYKFQNTAKPASGLVFRAIHHPFGYSCIVPSEQFTAFTETADCARLISVLRIVRRAQ